MSASATTAAPPATSAAAAAAEQPAQAAAAHAPAAEPEEELLDTVDDACRVTGRARRGDVHRLGLKHRAVYVWVFDAQGRLLLQRRSFDKKIGPGQWDLSAAEHLSLGESFHDAAERGLKEELGISARLPPSPAIPRHLRAIEAPLPGGGGGGGAVLRDVEFVESYRLDGYGGDVRVNDAEVIATRWVTLDEVTAEMAADPEAFTIWFREELPLLLAGMN